MFKSKFNPDGSMYQLDGGAVIKALLAQMHLGDSLGGLFAYATAATVLAVVVLVLLGKLAAKVGGAAAFEREAEG